LPAINRGRRRYDIKRYKKHKHLLRLPKACDYAFVFGGDGSIIAAAKALSYRPLPVVGVNVGKLGYLAEFSIAELEDSLDSICSAKLPIEKRMMLDCSVSRKGKKIFAFFRMKGIRRQHSFFFPHSSGKQGKGA
jgi:NAD kinase